MMQPAKEFMWGKAHDAKHTVEASLVKHWRATSIPYLAYLADREKGTTILKRRKVAIDKATDKLSKERQDIDRKLYSISQIAGERLYKHFKLDGYHDYHNPVTGFLQQGDPQKRSYPNPDDGDVLRKFLGNTTTVKALELAWLKVEEAIYLGGSKKLGEILDSFRATCHHLTK